MRISDIAKMANTSVATVSRVLNNSSKVAEPTRSRVLAVIKKTGYKPNLVASSLRKNYSKKLLIMVGTISNPFYSDFIVGFDEEARSHGYGVLLAVTHRQVEIEREYYEMLATNQVDGVASFIPTLHYKEVNEIARQYPFVACCFRGTNQYNSNYVCIDNVAAAYDMATYLIGLGHKKIAMLNGNYGRPYEYERSEGYRKALMVGEIPCREEYEVFCGYNYAEAYEATRTLLALKDPPTAIFAMSDDRAAGVVKYLIEHKLVPGVDVDVAGFDNTPVSETVTPAITTVAQPRLGIGREAVRLLLEQIENPLTPKKGIIMAHELIIRDSTRKATGR